MANHAEGVVRLNLDVRIDAREMSMWPVGCIRAFFAGLAQMQEAIEIARQSPPTSENEAHE